MICVCHRMTVVHAIILADTHVMNDISSGLLEETGKLY